LVFVSLLIIYMTIKPTKNNLVRIEDIISSKDDFFLDYENVFKHKMIPKLIHDDTFSESVLSKMKTEDISSFLKVHRFLKNEENEQFILSQKSRFDVPSFKLLSTNIILPTFMDSIIKQISHYSEYVYNGSIFTFYHPGIRDIEKEITEILHVFHRMTKFSNKSVKIRCHILFTDLKKRSTPGEKIIGLAKNINSGMTFGNTIIIWRAEDVVKVFVHEMVHLLKLDMGSSGNIIMKKILDSMLIKLSEDSISSLGEAYTETVAKIIYSIHRNNENRIEEFNKQAEFSLNQCARILSLNGITTLGNKINEITQYTYMTEYYILHAFFMYNIYISDDVRLYINFFKQGENKSNLPNILSNLNVDSFLIDMNIRLKQIPLNFGNTSRNLSMSLK